MPQVGWLDATEQAALVRAGAERRTLLRTPLAEAIRTLAFSETEALAETTNRRESRKSSDRLIDIRKLPDSLMAVPAPQGPAMSWRVRPHRGSAFAWTCEGHRSRID
jgi:hypothetical protein